MSAVTKEHLEGYDIVGIGSISNTIPAAYELADSLSQTGAVVVMGGPHVTFDAENTLRNYPGIDLLVLGVRRDRRRDRHGRRPSPRRSVDRHRDPPLDDRPLRSAKYTRMKFRKHARRSA